MAANSKGSIQDNGTLKFIGGLVLGVVCGVLSRSIGSSFGLIPKEQSGAGRKSSSSRKPANVSRPTLVPVPREELKMVLCVNMSLGMGKGKIGAQCAHAAVGVVDKYRPKNEALFKMWDRCAHVKIAVKVQNEEVMAELAHKAMQAGMPCYIVHDAGRTQIAAGSQTVLAIGPAYKSDLDRITGHLSLL